MARITPEMKTLAGMYKTGIIKKAEFLKRLTTEAARISTGATEQRALVSEALKFARPIRSPYSVKRPRRKLL